MRSALLALVLLAAPAQAAISFVGSACNSASPNATFSVALPGGLQADDFIICAFAVGDSPGADNNLAANGYNELADLANTADTGDIELWVGGRYFVGGDTTCPATGTFTAIGGTNASNAACVLVFRGVATVADGGPTDTATTTDNGQDTSDANPPSINTSGTAGIWTVVVGATAHTGGATATYTAPTGYTTNFDQRAHNDNADVLIGMGYNSGPSDPEDPGTFTAATVGTAADNSWAAATIALKAAPEPACTPDLSGLLGVMRGCP